MTFWKKGKEAELLNEDQPGEPTVLIGKSEQPPAPITTSFDSGSPKNKEMSLEERLENRYGKARSALGSGTVIQGKLSFDTPVRIDGKLGGEVFSSKALIVGPTGNINAEVHVASLVVMGAVKGNIVATDRVEVLKGGQIEGNITCPIIAIEEGSMFNGSCKMPQPEKQINDRRNETADRSTVAAKQDQKRPATTVDPQPIATA